MTLKFTRKDIEKLIRNNEDFEMHSEAQFIWEDSGLTVLRVENHETDWYCECMHDTGAHKQGRCFVFGPAPMDGLGKPRYEGNRCPCQKIHFCHVCRNGRQRHPDYDEESCRWCGRDVKNAPIAQEQE